MELIAKFKPSEYFCIDIIIISQLEKVSFEHGAYKNPHEGQA